MSDQNKKERKKERISDLYFSTIHYTEKYLQK